MDYSAADTALIRQTSDGRRYELVLYQAETIVYTLVLADGFSSPAASIQANWTGIEDINSRLAGVNVAQSPVDAWQHVGKDTWRRNLAP